MNLPSFLLTLYFLFYPKENIITLNINPNSITIGDSAVLIWKTNGMNHIFISQIGEVESNGQMKIFPNKTTSYLLIAEDTLGTFTKEVTLKVEGIKGEFPEPANFLFPISFNLEFRSTIKACKLIHNVLQNQMRYSLDWHHDPNTETYNIITSSRIDPHLIDSTEKRIAARQVAYALEISPSAVNQNTFRFQIKTFIQYRRKIEKTWRNETNEKYHHQVSHDLIEYLKDRYTTGF